MTTVKAILRIVTKESDEGTLYFRLIHKRKVRQIHTGNRIKSLEWDKENETVIILGDEKRQGYLKEVQKKLERKRELLYFIISKFEQSGKEYTPDDVVEEFSTPLSVNGFISYARLLINENRKIGKISASEHYATALNSLIRFYGEEEIPFDLFDSRLMKGYEAYLKATGLTPNSTSFYMRKLRAIYNQAVEMEKTEQRSPFKHVYTGIAKTNKRAVSLNVLKTLKSINLKSDPLSEMARDMFLFSFYTRGMSLVDMSF